MIGSRQRLTKGLFTDPLLLRLIIPQSLKLPLPNLLGCRSTRIFPEIRTLLKPLKKLASGIGARKRCRPFVPPVTLICAYNSIIQPQFDYCDIVWNNCRATILLRSCTSSKIALPGHWRRRWSRATFSAVKLDSTCSSSWTPHTE